MTKKIKLGKLDRKTIDVWSRALMDAARLSKKEIKTTNRKEDKCQ